MCETCEFAVVRAALERNHYKLLKIKIMDWNSRKQVENVWSHKACEIIFIMVKVLNFFYDIYKYESVNCNKSYLEFLICAELNIGIWII